MSEPVRIGDIVYYWEDTQSTANHLRCEAAMVIALFDDGTVNLAVTGPGGRPLTAYHCSESTEPMLYCWSRRD